MKNILMALTVLMAPPVWAQTYQCNFTEPFIQVAANSELGTVAFRVYGEKDVQVFKASSLTNSEQVLFTFEGASFSTLKVDFLKLGNDGMSDKVYQFEGVLSNEDGTQKLYGGCQEKAALL